MWNGFTLVRDMHADQLLEDILRAAKGRVKPKQTKGNSGNRNIYHSKLFFNLPLEESMKILHYFQQKMEL